MIQDVAFGVVAVAVFVASYRRGRVLSRYPVWRSAAIAVLAACLPGVWLIAWLVNRDLISDQWRQHRAAQAPARDVVS
jgi:hypothetical protein